MVLFVSLQLYDFVQDSLGAQEADTVQHVISAAGAPQDTLGSRVDLQAVSETVTGAEGMPIPYSPRTDDGLAMILLGCFLFLRMCWHAARSFCCNR